MFEVTCWLSCAIAIMHLKCIKIKHNLKFFFFIYLYLIFGINICDDVVLCKKLVDRLFIKITEDYLEDMIEFKIAAVSVL